MDSHAPARAGLADPATRAAVVARLAGLYRGRPVVVGPGILAGYTDTVSFLRGLGCEVLVLSTARGAGPVPAPGECRVVEVATPAAASVSEELRALDPLAHHLPEHAVAAIEELDPERRALFHANQFVTDDEPILGRRVVNGRPAAFLAMEDKLFAEQVWAAADVPRAPHRVVPVEPEPLADATRRLASPLGAVWTGDSRDGFHGGGNLVRWVVDEADCDAALGFFRPRCDRVRVMPFLDGVPCSIHGLVLPDGTAVLRPVEIAILRDTAGRRFVYGGLSTYWDPAPADREAMRDVARRVGDHLRAAHGYRGAFGIDGVMTADGFRPTELNTRVSGGLTTASVVDKDLFGLLQTHLLLGLDTGVTVADVESLVALMDAVRVGKPVAVVEGVKVGAAHDLLVRYDGRTLTRVQHDSGNVLSLADTPTGFFARIQPCAALRPGDRLAPLNAALLDYLAREYGADLPPVEAAPDLR
jgi:hypothetical protein